MRHRFQVTVAGAGAPVAVAVDDNPAASPRGRGAASVVVQPDGETPILVESLAPDLLRWFAGTVQVVARVESQANRVRVFLRGAELDVDVQDARKSQVSAVVAGAGRKPGGGSVSVRASMPGKVVKLFVKPGDEVGSGQAVAVVEAMKMENEMHAPRAGRVLRVAVADGATVEAGAELVVLESV